MRRFTSLGDLPTPDAPLLDGYVLLCRFLEPHQASLEQLGERADLLGAQLLEHPGVAGRVRRIACLDLKLVGDELRATKRWQHDSV